jgi:predicted transcriptional regulator
MEQKEMVEVDRGERSHRFRPLLAESATLARLASSFVDQAFDGALGEMLVHLVEDARLSAKDLRELEKRIAALRRKEERHA